MLLHRWVKIIKENTFRTSLQSYKNRRKIVRSNRKRYTSIRLKTPVIFLMIK